MTTSFDATRQLIEFTRSTLTEVPNYLTKLEQKDSLDCAASVNINNDYCKVALACREKLKEIEVLCNDAEYFLKEQDTLAIVLTKLVSDFDKNKSSVELYTRTECAVERIRQLLKSPLIYGKFKLIDTARDLHERINAQAIKDHDVRFLHLSDTLHEHKRAMAKHNSSINSEQLRTQITSLQAVVGDLKKNVADLKGTEDALGSLVKIVAILKTILEFAAVFL